MKYPEHCILFVDKHVYDYTRWHLLGIVGYYCGQYSAGKTGCLKAIECGLNAELDKKNLKFYEEKEKEIKKAGGKINNKNNIDDSQMTKKEFITKTIQHLKQQFPRLKNKQLNAMALVKWKKRN